ncbi:transcription factor HES-4-B-like [Bombyx mandarina]|uniref:Transcription factor HES-4-B-like n=1 Tax=Bombyx mandarina TaxID=7092 RepID=A0A6J2JPA1_BOMMA|nr:transcription factor HES-4-B-like [Bombyx mandarina]
MSVKMPTSEDDDSQTGFISEPTPGMSKAELRKTNKPIMEKKRRARINRCLNELKDLLLDSEKDPTRHSKLEKADILELTVKHLQKLQRQQLAAAIAADPAVLQRFKSGFGDCAVEVRRYLSRLASVPTGLRHRLGNHLTSCISGIERLHPPVDYGSLVPDPLRLDDDRPSAFHFVKSLRPTSPPLSPLSCDSACDSSTELETPPRPVQAFPFPTPPSRSASDQDSSPETQKPTVSSTTISPETLKQEALKTKKYMEPLSIVIDVENYKIGIDASPKRAVDYSIRHKLKRPMVDLTGPIPKLPRVDPEGTPVMPEKRMYRSPEKVSAFKRVPERHPVYVERRLTIPESIPSVGERLSLPTTSRTVISHTAVSLAQSSRKDQDRETRQEADTSSKSPGQGTSSGSEMWRPW